MGRYNVREPYLCLIPIKPHQEKKRKEKKRKSKPINGKVAWILIDIRRENRKQGVKMNQLPPVMDDPQLSYYPVSSW